MAHVSMKVETDLCHLTVIDLEEAKGDGRNIQKQKLYDALTTTGFFLLKGVTGYDEDMILQLTKWFFSLTLTKKMKIAKKMFNANSNHMYRGYFPIQEGEISHKEGFEIGPDILPPADASAEERLLTERNQWPLEGSNQDFKEKTEALYHSLSEAGKELMQLIAEIWHLDSDYFANMFSPSHLSTFRLLHYPPRSDKPIAEAIDRNQVLLCSEHKDSGLLTLLSTFDYSGLQIRDEDGNWVSLKTEKQHLVVNIGELLATISGGVLKATNHRVVDTGEDRYSVPFFLEPNFGADINIRLPLPAELAQTTSHTSVPTTKVLYGPWLISQMKKFAEYKHLIV